MRGKRSVLTPIRATNIRPPPLFSLSSSALALTFLPRLMLEDSPAHGVARNWVGSLIEPFDGGAEGGGDVLRSAAHFVSRRA